MSDEQFMKVFFDDTLKNKTYETQIERYCMLGELDEGHVSYCLENSPDEVVQSHAKKLWKDAEGEGYYPPESFIEEVRSMHNFDHLPDWARVKTFTVKITTDRVAYLTKRAEIAREYFDELLDKYNSRKR